MSIPTNPTQKSPERAFQLQKYLLLHSQHDALKKHIDQIAPSLPGTSTTTPARSRHGSLSVSPPSPEAGLYPHRSYHPNGSLSRDISPLKNHPGHRRFSMPAMVDERLVEEIEEDEEKLKECNQQIKSTLTDLLNCESVKGDRRYSRWVQSRLMDVEKELKERRSRSCERKRTEDMEGMLWERAGHFCTLYHRAHGDSWFLWGFELWEIVSLGHMEFGRSVQAGLLRWIFDTQTGYLSRDRSFSFRKILLRLPWG